MPFPKVGKKLALRHLFWNYTSLGSMKLKLAKDIAAVDDDDVVLGDIDECDFDGYAAVSDPGFEDPTIDGSDRGDMLSDLFTWTAGAGIAAPQTIVGMYITEVLDGNETLLWFKRLASTVTLANPDEVFERKLRFKDDDLVF